jgi:hypothetical protein
MLIALLSINVITDCRLSIESATPCKGGTHVTRYRIYRNFSAETTYISAHEGSMVRNPQEFPNLDIALAVLRQGGIPEYEIKRVTKELAAINGAIVQAPESIIFS